MEARLFDIAFRSREVRSYGVSECNHRVIQRALDRSLGHIDLFSCVFHAQLGKYRWLMVWAPN